MFSIVGNTQKLIVLNEASSQISFDCTSGFDCAVQCKFNVVVLIINNMQMPATAVDTSYWCSSKQESHRNHILLLRLQATACWDHCKIISISERFQRRGNSILIDKSIFLYQWNKAGNIQYDVCNIVEYSLPMCQGSTASRGSAQISESLKVKRKLKKANLWHPYVLLYLSFAGCFTWCSGSPLRLPF